MRVAFLSTCVRGGGAGWSLYYLIKHLDRTRFEPLVVVPAAGIFEARYAELGVELVIAPALPERTAQLRFASRNRLTEALSTASNLWDAARTIPWLAKLARDRAVDLVHCNNMAAKPVGAAAAEMARLPCILHARNLHVSWNHRLLYCHSVARLPAVRRVIANSEATAAPYRAAVAHKVSVVHNGIDLAEYTSAHVTPGQFRARLGIAGDTPLVGYTGNIVAHKGPLILVRAAGMLHKRGLHAHVAIVGRVPVGTSNDYLLQCQAEAKKLGLERHIHFTGFIPDVRPAVVDFDVLAVPSFKESFGRSIIEAQALGTAVVASHVGGIPEIIQDGSSGLLVPHDNPEALAIALERVLADSALRVTLADTARIAVAERFDVRVLTRRLEAIFAETIAGEPAAV